MSGNRRLTRRAVVQALYHWQFNPEAPDQIAQRCLDDASMQGGDAAFFLALWQGVLAHIERLDPLISAQISERRWADISEVERAILRLAAYELAQCADVPYRVVINEALELAKDFGADQGHRFVNGVLDKLAQQWRQAEIGADASRRGG